MAQEPILSRDDGVNLSGYTAPPFSNLAKQSSDGKSLLRSEPQVPTKLEEPGATAPRSSILSLKDEGAPCWFRCHLASEVRTHQN